MIAVDISTEPDLEIGEPITILWERSYFSNEAPFTGYDVAPDGRFLMVRFGDQHREWVAPPQINVVLDWLVEIQELVGGR